MKVIPCISEIRTFGLDRVSSDAAQGRRLVTSEGLIYLLARRGRKPHD